MSNMTPREIVQELDKHIIGQDAAKRAVAIALRNRWRRMQVDAELRSEITPKNILMIGPTGVGKTEIARRLARLSGSPFIKVEASKFTEVGYVGRDVESIASNVNVAVSEDGKPQGSMGIAVGDYLNEGRLSLLVTNFAEEYNASQDAVEISVESQGDYGEQQKKFTDALRAMRILSGAGYGIVRPVFRKTTAIGSLMRRKLEPDPSTPQLILTMHGEGYQFTAVVERSDPTREY